MAEDLRQLSHRSNIAHCTSSKLALVGASFPALGYRIGFSSQLPPFARPKSSSLGMGEHGGRRSDEHGKALGLFVFLQPAAL